MTSEKEISIWSKALLQILETISAEEMENRDVLGRLAEILKKKRKGYLLPKIFSRTQLAYLKKHRVELFLAREHSPETLDKIKEKFPQYFPKKANVQIEFNESLIGGFRIKTSDFFFLASVKDYLDELKLKAVSK